MMTRAVSSIRFGLLIVVALAMPLGATLSGQVRAADEGEASAPREGASSPRSTLETFRRSADAGRYAAAAKLLDFGDAAPANAPALAKQLHAVLDQSLRIDLDELSDSASGDTADGLPAQLEELGTIVDSSGHRAPVRLVRLGTADGTVWRFSRATVRHIPAWYATLPDRWILEHLPGTLVRTGPLGVRWWQWVALPASFVLAGVIGWLVAHAVRATVARLVMRSATSWDDAVLERLRGPLIVACTLGAFAAVLPFLSLDETAARSTLHAVRVGFLAVLFWSAWRLVDVMREVLAGSGWGRASTSSRALLPLAGRIAKVGVLAIGAVAVLSTLGYPVASLVAGLGLGGLALALAAQKTVENLFGAFSIGIDQPFREGDFVKIEDFVGTVEAIGLRSTRFRTLDRTVITIPNGKLADMRLESFAVRDRIRLAMNIRLAYETTSDQMRQVLSGVERLLRVHPKIWPDAVVVRFGALGASALDVEVMAWFQTSDWGEFQLIRQEVLLGVMRIVEQAGTSFAFPTRTIHVASVPDLSSITSPREALAAGR